MGLGVVAGETWIVSTAILDTALLNRWNTLTPRIDELTDTELHQQDQKGARYTFRFARSFKKLTPQGESEFDRG
jgi:hypothetical protein